MKPIKKAVLSRMMSSFFSVVADAFIQTSRDNSIVPLKCCKEDSLTSHDAQPLTCSCNHLLFVTGPVEFLVSGETKDNNGEGFSHVNFR